MNQSSVVLRSFSTSARMQNAIKRVTVIGGGLMGSGIAQVTAQAGQKVTLVDVNEDLLSKSKMSIQNSLLRVAKKLHKDQKDSIDHFVSSAMARVHTSTNLEEAVKDTDLVIEAIIENLKIKQDMFEKIDKIAAEATIFASNTSSLPIGEIAARVQRKDRFGGLHFFNPVPVMKLLEVVRIPETSEKTYQSMMEWGAAVGKVCITCKDTPGFVVNRLLIPYTAEAVRLYENGVATVKDIDIAMKLGAGYPMGPFELMDYTGVDTALFVINGWHQKDPSNPLYQPSETLKKMVKEGKLGVKSGEGWYKYNSKL